VPIPIDKNRPNDLHIAHYKDLGEWARHYSIVRMTVGMLFVVLAFGVVLFQWQHPTFGLLVVAAAMALFGAIVFGVFTALTFDRLNNQIAMINQARKDLGVEEPETRTVNYWRAPGGLPIAYAFVVIFGMVLYLWWNQ
jgi:Domain of unknown function (DUF1772)